MDLVPVMVVRLLILMVLLAVAVKILEHDPRALKVAVMDRTISPTTQDDKLTEKAAMAEGESMEGIRILAMEGNVA